MAKGWKGDSAGHSMAARGIKTKSRGVVTIGRAVVLYLKEEGSLMPEEKKKLSSLLRSGGVALESFDSYYTDKLSGGLADDKKPSDFNQKALTTGILIELEHTDNFFTAVEITMDHLTEDPDYYEKILVIEGKSDKYELVKKKRNKKSRKSKAVQKARDEGLKLLFKHEDLFDRMNKANDKFVLLASDASESGGRTFERFEKIGKQRDRMISEANNREDLKRAIKVFENELVDIHKTLNLEQMADAETEEQNRYLDRLRRMDD